MHDSEPRKRSVNKFLTSETEQRKRSRDNNAVLKNASSSEYFQTKNAYSNPCLGIVAILCFGIILQTFTSILIPLLFSFFITYLADPIINALVNFPNEECCLRCCLPPRHNDSKKDPLLNLHSRNKKDYLPPPLSPRRSSSHPKFQVDRLPPICQCCIRSFHIPRCFAVLITVAVGLGFFAFIGWILIESINQIKDELDKYEQGLEDLSRWFSHILSKLGLNFQRDIEPILLQQAKIFAAKIAAFSMTFIEQAVLIIIFLTYLLSTPIRPKEGIWSLINNQIEQYIRMKTMLSFIVGIFIGLLYQILSIDLAWVFALVSFVCNFIPNVGSIIATLAPIPIIFLDPTLSVNVRILALVAPVVLHQIMGNFIEPKVFGNKLNIHPIVVLVSLGIFSILWDVPGMIMAVPLTVVIHIVTAELWGVDCTFVKVLEGRLFEKYTEVTSKNGKSKKATISQNQEIQRIHRKTSRADNVGFIK